MPCRTSSSAQRSFRACSPSSHPSSRYAAGIMFAERGFRSARCLKQPVNGLSFCSTCAVLRSPGMEDDHRLGDDTQRAH
eukprot:10696519-Alexandrium_andersonii.AAC.1